MNTPFCNYPYNEFQILCLCNYAKCNFCNIVFLVPDQYLAFADDKYQMNMLWNKSPFGHMKPVATTTSEASKKFKLAQMRGSWVKSSKESSMYGQLHMPDTQLPNGFTALYHDVDKPLPLKGTAAEVLNQGN